LFSKAKILFQSFFMLTTVQPFAAASWRPLSSLASLSVVDAGEVFAGVGDLQELEIGSHALQLHREVFLPA
jgi:hypothetical protein